MSFVRTVLGDVAMAELGVCYAHEHIIIDESYITQIYPEFQLDSVDKGAMELKDFFSAGGRAMVDSMPCDCGRNVEKLAEISRRSKVHILAPTGIHLKKYYPKGHWSTRSSAEILAGLFVGDIEAGIDRNDYGGPEVQRTAHKAGLIKVAGGCERGGLNEHEKKIFEAAAIAHARTGAPILTHTEQGAGALEQVDWLEKNGVDIRHVVLSHTDRKPDLGYHKEVLSSGVFVEYDSAFRWKPEQGNPTADLVVALFECGFGDQIMLGMDAARHLYWKRYGGSPGLTFLLDRFWSLLQEMGMAEAEFRMIFCDNPARAYSFGER